MEIKDIISSGLLEMHATGIASDAESAQVQEWARQYPEVKAELDAIEKAMETYIMSHAIEPSAGLKQIVLQSTRTNHVQNNAQPAKVISISPVWKYAAAASLILLIGSSILNLVYFNKLETTRIAYEQTQQELLAANQSMTALNEDMSVVKNKYSKSVSLDGLPAAPEAEAKVFWM
ncbi:MAG: hypothetical protein H7X88_07870, partial [Gloeobacteraceae cyanobacterium ES-bin-316]|nr:hypothetical protein [Ferruginibacter sp.]